MPTIETDLKDILTKFDQRFDRLEQKLDKIDNDLTELNINVATVKVEIVGIKEDVKDLKTTQRSQLWALIVTIIGALTAGVIRFGFFTNP